MLPLMLRLREHAAEAKIRVEIATLDKYPEARIDVATAIQAVMNRRFVTQAKFEERSFNLLFLISVSSSGRLCGLFRKLVEDSRIAVVCRTTDDQLPCHRDLVTVKIRNWPAEKCELCATHPRIQVDPKTYELLPHLDLKREVVSYKKAREKAPFWSMASRKDAVQLHKTVNNRHFSVWLDTERMAEDDWFRGRCLSALRSLAEQDVILIPEHRTSRVVRGMCEEVFPNCPTHTVPSGEIEERLSGPIRQAKRILIADDAIVTGETMFNFRSAIYKITQPNIESKPSISVFAMVSRTADRIPLESLERRYRDTLRGAQMACGEEVFLPDEQQCPWCKEQNFLTNVIDHLPADPEEIRRLARDRIEQLNQRPLMWPFFMLKDGHGLPDNPQAVDSFFGTRDEPLNPYAAFAAGSCVAQTMKMELGNSARSTKKPHDPKAEHLWRKVLTYFAPLARAYHAVRYVFGYPLAGLGVEFKYADMSQVYDSYFETSLLSPLLRTFDGVDVRHAGIDEKFDKKFKFANPVRTYPGVITELAYAAIDGKIPSRAIRSFLEKWQGHDRWFRMLLAIMNAVEAR